MDQGDPKIGERKKDEELLLHADTQLLACASLCLEHESQ